MLEALFAGLGCVLIAGVFLDALTTTLAVSEGAGPVTRRVTGLVWSGLLRLHRQDSNSTFLAVAGPALLVGSVLGWVIGLWAGWTLVFLAGSPGIVQSSTGVAAELPDVMYYAGFTVFTLGVGDFVATNELYRVLTAIASFTGLFLITLAITYLISVVSAVVTRRALAVQINALGASPVDIVLGGWEGDSFSSGFEQHLIGLTGELATTAEQHLAYPVLHYFHSRTPVTAAPVAVAHLDEALLTIQTAVDRAAQPGAATVTPARNAIGRYLRATGVTGGSTTNPEPPTPDLARLAEAEVPLADPEVRRERLGAESDRRRQLARLVHSDGWTWQ